MLTAEAQRRRGAEKTPGGIDSLQGPQDRLARYALMLGNHSQDCAQSSDSQGGMGRDRNSLVRGLGSLQNQVLPTWRTIR